MNASSTGAFSSASTQNPLESSPTLAEEIATAGAQVVIALLGVLGNISAFLVIGKQSRKRSTTDFYIRALSVADLLVLSVNFPLVVVTGKLPTNWPFGGFFCRYLYPIPETFYGASVWTIVAIAFERYRGIVLGLPVRRDSALRRARRTVAVLWLLSFVVFSLPLYFFMKYEENAATRLCNVQWPGQFFKAYAIVLLLCSYVGPLVCICWTYIGVNRSLQRSNTFIKTMFDGKDVTLLSQQALSNTEGKRLHQNKRAHRILTPVAVLFAMAMLPLTVLRTLIPFCPHIFTPTLYQNLLYFVVMSTILNSAGNPIIYAFSCEDFRAGLKELFCGHGTRRGKRSGSSCSNATRSSAS